MKLLDMHRDVAAFLDKVQGLRIADAQITTSAVFDVVDPSFDTVAAQVSMGTAADIDHAVSAARAALSGPWGTMTAHDRGQLLWKLADAIEANKQIFGELDAIDNGKPMHVARDVDAVYSARHFRYFAGWPSKFEGRTIPVSSPGKMNFTKVEPVGVCGLITPWNYPTLMVAWKLAPALAAGNTIVLKPAEQTPLTALYLADLARQVGFPAGVLNVVPGLGRDAGAALAAHPGVDKVGFTGSTETGRRIVEGSVGNLKKVSLELGGKAANILFADADLDKAVAGSFWALFGNNGQSCTAGARLFVHRSIKDQVVERLAEMAKGLSVGPGMDAKPHDLGPVISRPQMEKVLGYIDAGRAQGAEVVAGGARQGKTGYFVAPTVMQSVTDNMTVAREEIFGPVLCVLDFDDEEEVIARANDTEFGLAAGGWTQDLARAMRLSEQLKAGTLWINTWGDTDPASPFGGMKQSGYGREMGEEAMALYSQTKSVWLG
ncbi:aldehyde dehydrogenase (NAD+)/phenylacetaldehyde dehydrogenase [Monaibacterium marinum]|uniref:Aldehyde dehydrogenase (NAD+)/phenylacetaldehyde dehydrogenase n=1 Tax=Pontivivens marinum TaxID=1690039 RepID=A0A2C9CLP7_9RHOB|nr:aldehyde dehydrogenase family protein [Monaibacterium marinum]SOH92193.1 aldehyde dehydrogenase (NAD+)/phenylacetaldehyde dehydrogenase [Monaibacterium marinum]